MPTPFAPVVDLTDDERAQLVAWSRRSKSANALAMRSRIVLAAAEGLNNTAIACPRVLIAILEQYQNDDGSITIPDMLRLYMGGRERIDPRA